MSKSRRQIMLRELKVTYGYIRRYLRPNPAKNAHFHWPKKIA